jgi:hypothetical protein
MHGGTVGCWSARATLVAIVSACACFFGVSVGPALAKPDGSAAPARAKRRHKHTATIVTPDGTSVDEAIDGQVKRDGRGDTAELGTLTLTPE